MSAEPALVPLPSEADEMAALDRVRLPVSTLAEAIPHLRRPFTPEAIRFKVQSVFKGKEGVPIGCLIVAYIDARLASERLNRVIPGQWSAEYKPVEGTKLMWCRLTVDGVARTDLGESTKGLSKDLVSDALKRAAVQFGVAVSCYALPEIKMFVSESNGRIEVRGKGDKQTIVLTDYGHTTLRAGYERWLNEHGVKRFGPPLDHGDVVGATVDEGESIAAGEGDGSEPGWDLPEDLVATVEALLANCEAFGFPLDRATVQMRVNGQPEDVVQAYVSDTLDMLATRKAES